MVDNSWNSPEWNLSWDITDTLKNGLNAFGNGISNVGNWIGDTFFGGSHEVNQTNQAIANQNIAFQQRENELTRMREDNAVQRAAADMTAAGMSKTLAAGNPASAQSLTAPNNGYQAQRNMAGLNMIDAIQNIAFKAKEANRADKLNNAQVANIEADTAGKNINNQTLAERLVNENTLTIAKTAQTEALTNLYKTQNYFEQLLGPKNAEKLDSEINLNLAKYEEALASAKYSDQMTKKAVEDTKKSIQETEYYNNLADEVKKKVDYLVEQISYEKLKILALDWDLSFAKEWGYPTGQYPSSLFGVLERMGKGGAKYDQHKREFAESQYTNFAHGYKNAMDELADFYEDNYTGGGLIDSLRKLFNFSPLNWLFGK